MSGAKQAPFALITGGAGFIGTNLADRILSEGRAVLVFDDLSRPGVEHNLRWLVERHGDLLQVQRADILDTKALRQAVGRAAEVYHLAAQVAVTTSLESPLHDFDVNARGTLNLLEALRTCAQPPPLVFTSTNKVYGALEDVALDRDDTRYVPVDEQTRAHGVDERRPLAFHSPYGCSKGAADQYVLDYARCFDLPAVVFRMSCIYGPHQRGTEDQGWVAHFLIRARTQAPLTIYGDGLQVRDLLYVDDLVDALLLATSRADVLRGQAFNIGGGPANTSSLRELMDWIADAQRSPARFEFASWRKGDQRYYVSDPRRFTEATGWRPRTAVAEGLARLHAWLEDGDAIAHPALSPAVAQ